MDMFWSGALSSEGTKVYDILAYQYALSIIPICAVLGGVMVFVMSTAVKRSSSQRAAQTV